MSEPKTTARPGAARCTIELYKEAFKFSAAHFTLFSARERERLHGHDFFVSCALTGPLGEGGLIADYGPVKRRLRALCGELDEVLLLPGASPWLQVEPGGDEVRATFAGRTMSFLATEVRILPIANITLEALSVYLLERLLDDGALQALGAEQVTLKVSAGPGQSSAACWRATP